MFLALRRAPVATLAATAVLSGALAAVVPGDVAQGAEPGYAVEVYKSAGGVDLKAHIFSPPGAGLDDPRPAVVFFHGGGWIRGGAEWCFTECRHFASRGLVAVAAEYRLVDRGGSTPLDSMADAKSAIRWVRDHARDLAVAPDRIVAAGTSSGGHLAAAAAMIESFDEPDEDESISSIPDALMLWFPAVDLARDPWFARLLGDRARVAECSPVAHVRRDLPPAIVFQGDRDDLTPLAGARLFSDELEQTGNRCDLHVYPGRGHLFTRDRQDMADTLAKADAFLASLGYGENGDAIERGPAPRRRGR
jgi:acetyl esterase/lipase